MIIWGALCILAAFGCFGMNEIIPGVFWAMVGSGLIAYGIHRNKQRQSQAQQQTVIVNNYTAPQEPKMTLAEISEQKRREMELKKLAAEQETEKLPQQPSVPKLSVVTGGDGFSVAGVTFKNDDGTSRQKILRGLCDGEDFISVPVRLEPYDYKGEDAVRVLTSEGCVGNIKRDDVQEVLELLQGSPKDMYMDINSFENENGKTIYRGDVYIDS